MNLPATLDVGEAISTCWDAVVVGAGPAGAVAAHQLARSGLSALLVERKEFQRRKVCGACLNLKAVVLLQQLGLENILDQLRAIPLDRFHVQSGGKRVVISLPGGVAVTRAALDAALVQHAIEAGAHFLPATSALLGDVADDGRLRHVELKQQGGAPEITAAKVVLIADGLGHSSLRQQNEFRERVATHSHVGLGVAVEEFPPAYEEGTIFMAVARQGYAGLVRVEDGSLNIAAAVDRLFVKSFPQPAGAIAAFLEQAGFPPIKALASASCLGTISLTRNTLRPACRRTLLLGDAAGYVEPFTGEGIATAMTCGVAAAELVFRRIHRWNPEDEEEWLRLYRRLVEDRHHWCRRLAWLLRHPAAVQAAVRVVARFPSMARPIVRRLNEA